MARAIVQRDRVEQCSSWRVQVGVVGAGVIANPEVRAIVGNRGKGCSRRHREGGSKVGVGDRVTKLYAYTWLSVASV